MAAAIFLSTTPYTKSSYVTHSLTYKIPSDLVTLYYSSHDTAFNACICRLLVLPQEALLALTFRHPGKWLLAIDMGVSENHIFMLANTSVIICMCWHNKWALNLRLLSLNNSETFCLKLMFKITIIANLTVTNNNWVWMNATRLTVLSMLILSNPKLSTWYI